MWSLKAKAQARRQRNTTDRNSGDRNTAFWRLGEDMERAKAVRVRALDNARSGRAVQRDGHGRNVANVRWRKT
jgi:hypothetical protein